MFKKSFTLDAQSWLPISIVQRSPWGHELHQGFFEQIRCDDSMITVAKDDFGCSLNGLFR